MLCQCFGKKQAEGDGYNLNLTIIIEYMQNQIF